jgi:NAD-dependent deacetylase
VGVGTSAVVYPAAQLPLLARAAGAVLVEVNPEETHLSGAYRNHVRVSASEALHDLLGPALASS